MNQNKLLKKLSFLLVMLIFTAGSVFAQANWYVNQTSGDDGIGDGSQGNPYRSISAAISAASDDDIVNVAAGTYTKTIEAAGGAPGGVVTITKTLKFIGIPNSVVPSATQIIIDEGIDVQPGLGETVNLGLASDGSLTFVLKDVDAGGEPVLKLTSGTLNITGTNVVITAGELITRVAGAISETPDVTNVSVTYSGGTLAAGPEMAASLGSGILTVTTGAVTFGSNVAFSATAAGPQIVVTGTADATFSGTVSFDFGPTAGNIGVYNVIDNQGTGDVEFNGNVAIDETGTKTVTVRFNNNGAGTLLLSSYSQSGSTTVDLMNPSTGTVTIGGGNYDGTVTNDGGGKIILTGNAEFSGAVVDNTGSTIKLNSNTLTLSKTGGVTLTTGDIVSVVAGTPGSGTLEVTGVATASAGNLPNVNVSGSGKLILGGNVQIDGNYFQSSTVTGALTDGGNNLTINGGNFTRTTVNPLDVALTGTLTFIGTPAQTFNPGAGMALTDLVVNKTGVGVGDLVMGATVEVNNDITLTNGTLNLGNNNIRMIGAGGTFTNTGSFYSSSGTGYLIVEGTGKTLTGTAPATWGNTDIRSGSGNNVTLGSNINFSGTLILRSGTLTANTVTLTTTNVTVPLIQFNLLGTSGATLASTLAVAAGVSYDLEYFGAGTAGAKAAGNEYKTTGIRHLSQNGSNGTNVTLGSGTITGNLTIAATETLTPVATITSTGDATHSLRGTLGGHLLLKGAAVTVNGVVASTDPATMTGDLIFDPANNNSTFTSTGLKVIGGDLDIVPTTATTGAVANVTMSTKVSTISGDVVVGTAAAATLNLNMPATGAGNTNTHVGDILVTSGALTYSRGSGATYNTIGGTVTLTAGTLTLGSDVTVTGTTTHTAGTLAMGSNDYDMNGDYTRTTGPVTGTGYMIVGNAGATFTPGASFSITRLRFDNGGANVTLAGDITVTDIFWHDNANIIDGGNDISIAGTYNYDAGTYTGTGTLIFTASTLIIDDAVGTFTVPNIVVNSTGTLTVETDDTSSPITQVTVSAGTFTQTKGNVDLEGNDLVITGGAGAFSRGANAGTWAMTSKGEVQFNNAALTFDPGSNWSVDYLNVNAAAANSTTKSFTVVKKLTLGGALTVSSSALTGNMTIGDGATIERKSNTATLSKIPVNAGMVNLLYSTAGTITVGKEKPSTDVVNNVTVNIATALTSVLTVNGTLSLSAMITVTPPSPDGQIIMADGSTLELKADGTTVLDKNVTKAGSMELVYNGATNTTTRELGNVSSGSYGTYTGNITTEGTVKLAADLPLNGNLTFDGGSFDVNGNDLSVQGNVVSTTSAGGGGFFTATGAGFVNFTGTANTTLSLDGNTNVPALVKLRMNKGSNENYVTLSGGNLNFAASPAILYLKSGVLATGAKTVLLRHDDDTFGNPTQGFSRTGTSHVVGNVSKLLDATGAAYGRTPAVALTRVEFPVGTMPASAPNYRPMSFSFNTLPTANLTLTVNNVDENPGGSNGFPIIDGDLTITNYPDFYWLVTSTLTLQPQTKYDIEASAEGYTDYESDGIQNVRFIRRFDNNIDNEWLLQGGAGYDNSTNVDVPVVIVRSAEGALSTQGARFTYSQLDKPPVISRDVASPAIIDEGDTLVVNYTATDPDFGQTASLGIVSKPEGSAWDGENDRLTWETTFTDSGNYTAIVSATDGSSTSFDTLTIRVNNVNAPPVIVDAPADTTMLFAGTEFSFTFTATDPDTDNLFFVWTKVAGPDSAKIIDSTGVFTWTPDSSDMGSSTDVTVMVADDGGLTDDTTFVLNVFQNSAPYWVVEVPKDTGLVGDAVAITYVAADPNPTDVLSFSFYDVAPDGATLETKGDTCIFNWTPILNQTAVYLIRIAVTDGEFSDSTQTELLIVATTSNVNGTVAYNVSGLPIPSAVVEIYSGATLVATDTTDAAGAFTFVALSPGAYTLKTSKTTGWGGSLSSDALETSLYTIYGDSLYLVTPLQKVAADVDGFAGITAGDALMILNRSVNLITEYAIDDWQFVDSTVALGTSDLAVELTGIAAGDARSDYDPSTGLPKASLAVNSSDVLKIKKAAEFEMPISVSQAAEIGSFTLKLRYPEQKLEFVGVRSNGGTLVSNVVDGVIHISWADFTARNSMKLNKGDAMAYVSFRATELFSKNEEVNLEVIDGSEIADRFAKSIDGRISVPTITVGIPDKFTLSQNYPNPFNPSTTIQYDLPENGQVTLTIYNTLGQSVATLVNQKQEAGSYEFKFNASSLASGVYLYRLHVQGVKDFTLTKKMLLMK